MSGVRCQGVMLQLLKWPRAQCLYHFSSPSTLLGFVIQYLLLKPDDPVVAAHISAGLTDISCCINSAKTELLMVLANTSSQFLHPARQMITSSRTARNISVVTDDQFNFTNGQFWVLYCLLHIGEGCKAKFHITVFFKRKLQFYHDSL